MDLIRGKKLLECSPLLGVIDDSHTLDRIEECSTLGFSTVYFGC